MNKKDLAKKIVDLLNNMADADLAATASLMAATTPFHEDIAHQLPVEHTWQNGRYSVGLLEVLNGIINQCEEGPDVEIRPLCDYKESADYPNLWKFEVSNSYREIRNNSDHKPQSVEVESKLANEILVEMKDILSIMKDLGRDERNLK